MTVSESVVEGSFLSWMPTPTCEYCISAPFQGVGFINDSGRSSSFVNNIVVDTNGTMNSGGMLTWDKKGQLNSSAFKIAMREVKFAQRYPKLALLHDYYASECANDVLCRAALERACELQWGPHDLIPRRPLQSHPQPAE